MNDFQKSMWRMACSIHEALLSRARAGPGIHLASDNWRTIQQLLRKCELAKRREWDSAQNLLLTELPRRLDALRYQIDVAVTALRQYCERPGRPTLSTIYQEIQSLREEFVDVECDTRLREIRVTTEPIVLEGIYLGPFQVCLEVGRLGHPSPYRIVALDPQPAASNESVTHPHVQDESLCEGE